MFVRNKASAKSKVKALHLKSYKKIGFLFILGLKIFFLFKKEKKQFLFLSDKDF